MSGQRIAGIGVSEGVRIGPAFVYHPLGAHTDSLAEREGTHASMHTGSQDTTLPAGREEALTTEQVEQEAARLLTAREAARRAYDELIAKAKRTVGEKETAILIGQQSLLTDVEFYPPMEKLIREQGIPAEAAVKRIVKQVAETFESLPSEYMRERAVDIRDIGSRLLENLSGAGGSRLADIERPVILVADDLTPSETIQLDPKLVLGFVVRRGGKTSHTAFLARSLGIAAIVGAGDALNAVRHGDLLVVDGGTGVCLINPDEATVAEYRTRMEEEARRQVELAAFRTLPAVSADGRRIEIAVNIGTVQDAEGARDSGAEGVGLYRTEFLFMHSDRLPSEEEQYDAYRQVAEMWAGKPVVIRTFDIGGDKDLPYLQLPKEMNPFLGYRAIRIGLDRPEMMHVQLRAILRASAHGRLKIMFPMISNLSEWRQAKVMLDGAKAELERDGVKFDRKLETGIMVEIPSTAVQADAFAKEVDFFSIGTNDLVQYTVAVDRTNERVAHLYDYFHPAVLRLIQLVIQAAHQEGKWVGMCGGMAGDPLAAPLLLGLGLDEWSMDSSSVAKVKEMISRLDSRACAELAGRLLQQDTAGTVREQLKATVKQSQDGAV